MCQDLAISCLLLSWARLISKFWNLLIDQLIFLMGKFSWYRNNLHCLRIRLDFRKWWHLASCKNLDIFTGLCSHHLETSQWILPISAQCCFSYRNQLFDLQCKSNDWFLYETQQGVKWVKKCNRHYRVSLNQLSRFPLEGSLIRKWG